MPKSFIAPRPALITGRKKSSSGGALNSDPNSLRSISYARVQDLLGWGEWQGLVNGASSILLDGTPLPNYTNADWSFTTGTQTQGIMPGFSSQETYTAVGVRVQGSTPVIRSLLNPQIDSVIVTIRIPQLFVQNTDGSVTVTPLQYKIEISLNGGAYAPGAVGTFNDKCTTDYLQGHEIWLPRSATPNTDTWSIRVTRITPDHYGDLQFHDDFIWDSYSEVSYDALTFPNCVIAGLSIDAQNFSNVPVRSYHVQMRKVKVPTNYDPVARTYATTGTGTSNGGWDGTFKVAYSNNPAWVWYDLATDPNIGIGLYVDSTQVDKWSLYDIAKYCDVAVPNGKGGTEPRFTCNFYLQIQADAMKVLNDVASNFRAMLYYFGGQLVPVQDKPVYNPFNVFTNSNVKEGVFNYTSTAQRARKTSVFVQFNDPDNNYALTYQPVEDYAGIARYGYNSATVAAFGCTSRAQAYRYGRMILQTEAKEYDVVTFTGGLEVLNNRPGDIILVQDRDRAGVAYGGRVDPTQGTPTTTSIPIDRPITIVTGKSYTLYVSCPQALADPSGVTDSTQTSLIRQVQAFSATVSNATGTTRVLTLATALPAAPSPGAVWCLSASDVAPAPYRIISIDEQENNQFEITANRYDITKYDATEVDPNFQQAPTVLFPQDGAVLPVTNLTATARAISTPDGVQNWIDLGWTNADPYANQFRVTYSVNGGAPLEVPLTTVPTVSIPAQVKGDYYFSVYAIRSLLGQMSIATNLDFNAADASPISLLSVTGLELKNKGNVTVFEGKDAKFVWRLNSPALTSDQADNTDSASEDGVQDPYFSQFLFQVYNPANNTLIFQDRTTNAFYDFSYEKNVEAMNGADPLRAFYVYVIAVDKWGSRSAPAILSVSNPAPSIPDIQYTAHYGTVEFRMSAARDTDFQGYRIWVDTANPIIPSTANLKYDGPDNSVLIPLNIGTTYYVQIAGYDVFGTTGLNLCPQFAVTPLATVDTDPPAVPTGITLTTSTTNQPDGTQQIKLLVTWTANTEPDFAAYNVAINKSGGSPFAWIYASTNFISATQVSFIVDPNTSYDVKLNAQDTSGNVSAWSTVVSLTSSKDTSAPAAPTWVQASIYLRLVYLTWNVAPESDFDHWELWQSATNSIGAATLLFANLVNNVSTFNLTASGLQTGQTLYYFLYAVDTSGNKSAVSASQALTLGGVPTPAGLSVTSALETQPDGTQLTYLTASCTAVSYTELSGYAWEVSTVSGAGNYYRGNTAAPNLKLLVAGNVLYYVRVEALDSSGGHGNFCTEVTTTAVKDTTAPAIPTSIVGASGIATAFFSWVSPTDLDLYSILIWRSTTNSFPGGTAYATVSGTSNTWNDLNVTPGTVYYYWFKSEDTSGNITASPSSSVTVTPGSVGASAIGSFALDLTKFYHSTIALQNDAWTNNSPSAGFISWNSHTLYYQGAAYTIAAGNTNNGYVYWDPSSTPTTYHTSATNPTLTDSQFMIATNVAGAHDLAWNAMANALIGTAYIQDAAITNAKIASLTADKIQAGIISSQIIQISGGTSGAIQSSNYVSGTTGWAIKGDGSAEFNTVTVRATIQGGTIQIGSSASNSFYCDATGNIWIGATTFASAPFKVSNTGTLTASSAVITGASTVAGSLQVGVVFQLGDSTHTTTSVLTSYNWVSNTSGFRILGDGTAEFNSISARGSVNITGGTIGSTSTTNIETGSNRAINAINGSYNITTAVYPTFNVTPSGAGLYLGANYMGYYNGSVWKTYMNNTGQFFLSGTGSHFLSWDGSTLALTGSMTITNGVDYTNVIGTKPPSNADVTLSAINGDLTITSGGLNLTGGRIQSSNFVTGSAGWKINYDGSAEFSNITVRGNLAAGAISSGAAVYNLASPSSTMPAVTAQSTSTTALTDTSTTPIMAISYTGWASGTGYSRTRFARSDSMFYVSFSGIVDNYITIWYKVNSGSWTYMPGSQQAAQAAGYGTIYTGVVYTMTLAGTDTIQFGVRGCDNGGTFFDTSKKGIYGTLTALCFNF